MKHEKTLGELADEQRYRALTMLLSGDCCPADIRFARKSVGLMREELAHVLKIYVDLIIAYEDGNTTGVPTRLVSGLEQIIFARLAVQSSP